MAAGTDDDFNFVVDDPGWAADSTGWRVLFTHQESEATFRISLVLRWRDGDEAGLTTENLEARSLELLQSMFDVLES